MKTAIVFCALVAVGLGHVISRDASWRIVGGDDAKEGQFPFIISLRYLGSHNCGGTIIGNRWIVTAGHCVYGYEPSQITIVVGSNLISSGGRSYNVKRLIPHEKYGSNGYFYDIGLVELTENIDFSQKNVRSLKVLPEFIGEEEVTLAGWGMTGISDPIPDKLQFIKLRTISVEDCNKEIETNEAEICTFTKAGEGACYGDSGGPLIFENKLTGIVSRGYPCALGKPDVFTRPSAYCDWIQEKTDGDVSC